MHQERFFLKKICFGRGRPPGAGAAAGSGGRGRQQGRQAAAGAAPVGGGAASGGGGGRRRWCRAAGQWDGHSEREAGDKDTGQTRPASRWRGDNSTARLAVGREWTLSGPKDPFEGERNVDLSQLRYSLFPRRHTVEKRCEKSVRTPVSFYLPDQGCVPSRRARNGRGHTPDLCLAARAAWSGGPRGRSGSLATASTLGAGLAAACVSSVWLRWRLAREAVAAARGPGRVGACPSRPPALVVAGERRPAVAQEGATKLGRNAGAEGGRARGRPRFARGCRSESAQIVTKTASGTGARTGVPFTGQLDKMHIWAAYRFPTGP